jgi:hypothetical protein
MIKSYAGSAAPKAFAAAIKRPMQSFDENLMAVVHAEARTPAQHPVTSNLGVPIRRGVPVASSRANVPAAAISCAACFPSARAAAKTLLAPGRPRSVWRLGFINTLDHAFLIDELNLELAARVHGPPQETPILFLCDIALVNLVLRIARRGVSRTRRSADQLCGRTSGRKRAAAGLSRVSALP